MLCLVFAGGMVHNGYLMRSPQMRQIEFLRMRLQYVTSACSAYKATFETAYLEHTLYASSEHPHGSDSTR